METYVGGVRSSWHRSNMKAGSLLSAMALARLVRFLEFIFGFKLHFARAGIKRAEGWRREQRVVGGQTADW